VHNLEPRCWLTIPSGGRTNYLPSIIENSGIPENQIVLIRTKRFELNLKVNIIDDFGPINIQRWWNTGIDYAQSKGAHFCAILNDDVYITPGIIPQMIDLAILENTTLVRLQHDWGHCFLLRLDRGVRPDESFRWYMGDHDLERQAKKKGGVSIFHHTEDEIKHIEPSKLTAQSIELQQITKQDYRVWFRKYPLDLINHFKRKLFKKSANIQLIMNK
jgi:hypothetical protein